ncbi:MAG: alpha/beta fold hydrolase [Anaerolineae bacterium]|nr:alpha/beta fold hydrolase [Anaerolineae bacterium]
MARLTRFVTLMVIFVFAVSVLPVAAQDGGTPKGLRGDSPKYALSGPYAVGMRTFAIDEGTDNALHGIIWYPALNPLKLDPAYAYPISVGPGMVIHLNGHALEDPPPDMTGAPYPLVFLSHGFGVRAATYAFLNEHLASQGFVVMAVDYPEVWDPQFSQIWAAFVNRPIALNRLIAYADEVSTDAGPYAGLFNTDHFALMGHSMGGYTSLAGAGARIDTEAYAAACSENPTGTDAWVCPVVVPKIGEMASLAGFDAPPEGLWPSWGDSRVNAVIDMAFGSNLVPQAGVTGVTAPLLTMIGTDDTLVGYDQAIAVYHDVGSDQKALVTFKGAGHFVFQWACEDFPEFVAIGYGAFCVDPVWDLMRTHDLTNHFVTAFLLATVKGDRDAAAVFGPDAEAITGIEVEASGL